MGSSRWTLVFICIWLKVFETKASWTATLPSSVRGLSGSCVVIPCTFSYPNPPTTPTAFTGMWMESTDFILHPVESEMKQQYRRRTTLLGDASQKNCSLKIDPLRPSDTGPFHFRVEMQDYAKYSYKEKVSISVMSEPDPARLFVKEEMKEKEAASASCSASHSCPGSPPVFTWSHSGEEHHQSQQLDDHQWNATSTLTFHPTHADHSKSLWCTVTYRGGQQQKISKILHVKYAPVNVMVEYDSNIKEGQTVSLTCSSNAHPPASSYEWQNETGARLCQGNLYVVPNVSRHLGAVLCTAINDEGQATSRPVRLNVSYAPEIKAESSCSSEDSWVKCECIVDSNPPSEVTFKLGDKILLGATRQGGSSYRIRVLETEFESSNFVQCWANNTQGSANLQLSSPDDGMRLIIYIATGAAAFLVVLLIAVGVFSTCRRQSGGDAAPANMSSMMTERAQDLPRCAKTSRKETYDDAPCSEIYANDSFYGNIGTNWDDPIYGNV